MLSLTCTPRLLTYTALSGVAKLPTDMTWINFWVYPVSVFIQKRRAHQANWPFTRHVLFCIKCYESALICVIFVPQTLHIGDARSNTCFVDSGDVAITFTIKFWSWVCSHVSVPFHNLCSFCQMCVTIGLTLLNNVISCYLFSNCLWDNVSNVALTFAIIVSTLVVVWQTLAVFASCNGYKWF